MLRLIQATADGGKRNGKPVGICGEAAADPLLAVVLVGIGATTLSMAPTALADVRASLLQYTREDAARDTAATDAEVTPPEPRQEPEKINRAAAANKYFQYCENIFCVNEFF